MDDDDVQLLTIEVIGQPDALAPGTEYELLGLDTAEPILKLNQSVYLGSYEDVSGTRLLFDRDSDGQLKYTGKSTKRLVFRKAIVAKRAADAMEAEAV